MLAVAPRDRWDELFYSPILAIPGKTLAEIPDIAPSYPAAHSLLAHLLLPHDIPGYVTALCSERDRDHGVDAAFRRATGRDLEAALREAAGL